MEAIGNGNEDEEETYVPDEGWNDLLKAYLQDFMKADTMSGRQSWEQFLDTIYDNDI